MGSFFTLYYSLAGRVRVFNGSNFYYFIFFCLDSVRLANRLRVKHYLRSENIHTNFVNVYKKKPVAIVQDGGFQITSNVTKVRAFAADRMENF